MKFLVLVFGLFIATSAFAQDQGKAKYDAAMAAANANKNDEAFQLYKQSCDMKYGAACVTIGHIILSKSQSEADQKAALGQFILGCDYGRKTGCMAAGEMIENGKGAPKSRSNALKYYEIACDGGEGGGCFKRGMAFDDVDMPIIESIEIGFLQKGCDFLYTISCEYLGQFKRDGVGTSKDEAAALNIFQTACDFDNGMNCLYAAKMYEDGIATEKSPKKAYDAALLACDNNVADACDYIEELKTKYQISE